MDHDSEVGELGLA